MASIDDTGQPRTVIGTPDRPDRTPSVSDVMAQVAMSGMGGVSAQMVSQGISCSAAGAFDVLLSLEDEGRVVAKTTTEVRAVNHHTHFTLPPPAPPAIRVRLTSPRRSV